MAKRVIDVIEHRHHTGSLPGKRTDKYKLVLAVEGGGMRGVVTGGSLKAIEELGLLNVFDTVYGSSSGAYNALYFISGNVSQGAKLYLDYANNHDFVSWWRFLRGGPLFDTEYMIHQMSVWAPVDWQRVLYSPVPFHVPATTAEDGQPAIIKNFKNTQEIIGALKSASHVPYSRHPSTSWRHRHYVDTAISDPFCLNSAIKEGATHILVLASMPIKRRHNIGIVDRKLVVPYLSKVSQHLGEAYLHHDEYSVNGLNHIWNHYDGTHISVIAPSKAIKLPSQLTIKRQPLAKGFLAGLQAVMNELDFDKREQTIINSVTAELKI